MLGDPEMNDLTSPVPDHEPGVQKSESNGRDDEEDRREFEQVPHSESHSARVQSSIRD
jgi:hypothetical protein